MSSFRYQCSSCKKVSKNFNRYTQCQECFHMFCTECTDNELAVVKGHFKQISAIADLMKFISDQGGLKIRGKGWSFNKLCCVDCYNGKLAELGVPLEKSTPTEETTA